MVASHWPTCNYLPFSLKVVIEDMAFPSPQAQKCNTLHFYCKNFDDLDRRFAGPGTLYPVFLMREMESVIPSATSLVTGVHTMRTANLVSRLASSAIR